jgi:hypothetical protein
MDSAQSQSTRQVRAAGVAVAVSHGRALHIPPGVMRRDPFAQVWVADDPDARLGTGLADHEGFNRRLSSVGICREDPRIQRGTRKASDRAPLPDWRQTLELYCIRFKFGFTRRNFQRTDVAAFFSWHTRYKYCYSFQLTAFISKLLTTLVNRKQGSTCIIVTISTQSNWQRQNLCDGDFTLAKLLAHDESDHCRICGNAFARVG